MRSWLSLPGDGDGQDGGGDEGTHFELEGEVICLLSCSDVG